MSETNPASLGGDASPRSGEIRELEIELQLETGRSSDSDSDDSSGLSTGLAIDSFRSMQVEKEPLRVKLLLADGNMTEGEIFLSVEPHVSNEHALRHFVEEIAQGFFPLRQLDGATAIVHESSVQWFCTTIDQRELPMADARHVRLDLGHGGFLDGTVILDVGVIQPRVSDLLNATRPFLTLESGNLVYLVNRLAIQRAYDLGPA